MDSDAGRFGDRNPCALSSIFMNWRRGKGRGRARGEGEGGEERGRGGGGLSMNADTSRAGLLSA